MFDVIILNDMEIFNRRSNEQFKGSEAFVVYRKYLLLLSNIKNKIRIYINLVEMGVLKRNEYKYNKAKDFSSRFSNCAM